MNYVTEPRPSGSGFQGGRSRMRFAPLFFGFFASWHAFAADYFVPSHRVSGIGVSRDDISTDVLQARTDLMIQSQTFGIMREPLAIAGAKRITSAKLQSLFRAAEKRSG